MNQNDTTTILDSARGAPRLSQSCLPPLQDLATYPAGPSDKLHYFCGEKAQAAAPDTSVAPKTPMHVGTYAYKERLTHTS